MTKATDKPYVIAAMIFLSKVKHPADMLTKLLAGGRPRSPKRDPTVSGAKPLSKNNVTREIRERHKEP
jgi:hypothetical protein